MDVVDVQEGNLSIRVPLLSLIASSLCLKKRRHNEGMIIQWSFVNHSLNTGSKKHMYMYMIKLRTGQQCFLVFNFFLKTSLKFATTQ